MTESKDIKLPQQASYSGLPEYIEHVNNIVASYDSPSGVLGELVRQVADSIWWVKTYQKDKDHLIVMRMADCLVDRRDFLVGLEKTSLRVFEALFKSWSGEYVEPEDQAYLDSSLGSKGHNLASLRAEAVRNSVKDLEVVDRRLGPLGHVVGMFTTPAHDILEVDGPTGEILIPAIEPFLVRIDRDKAQLHVDLPEGLVPEEESKS